MGRRQRTGMPDNGHKEYCHPKFYGKTPNQLFLNNGDGTFTDVSVSSGFRAHPGKGMGGGDMADYDLDGRMDFFIANDLRTRCFITRAAGSSMNPTMAEPCGSGGKQQSKPIEFPSQLSSNRRSALSPRWPTP